MALLDWIKHRGEASPEKENGKAIAREHGHDSLRGLAQEISADEKLAKQRDAAGREPECAPPTVYSIPKTEAVKARPRRERVKGHDYPY